MLSIAIISPQKKANFLTPDSQHAQALLTFKCGSVRDCLAAAAAAQSPPMDNNSLRTSIGGPSCEEVGELASSGKEAEELASNGKENVGLVLCSPFRRSTAPWSPWSLMGT